MEIRLTSEQEAQLTELAAHQGRAPDELARDVLRRGLDDEARFIAAVKLGLSAADAGDFVRSEEIWEGIERILRS